MMSGKTAARVVRLVIGLLVAQLFLTGYVFYESYTSRLDLVSAQRDGCERIKLDRIANSEFQNAHKNYLQKVTSAASVMEDVKSAARDAIEVYSRTSRELTKRAKINCTEVFP